MYFVTFFLLQCTLDLKFVLFPATMDLNRSYFKGIKEFFNLLLFKVFSYFMEKSSTRFCVSWFLSLHICYVSTRRKYIRSIQLKHWGVITMLNLHIQYSYYLVWYKTFLSRKEIVNGPVKSWNSRKDNPVLIQSFLELSLYWFKYNSYFLTGENL